MVGFNNLAKVGVSYEAHLELPVSAEMVHFYCNKHSVLYICVCFLTQMLLIPALKHCCGPPLL